MKCEAEGIIIVELPTIVGTTKKGKDFEKREYVLQTTDIYKKAMKFTMMSFDGAIEEPPQVGDNIKVRFTVEAKECKGKWFNEVRAYSIDKVMKV